MSIIGKPPLYGIYSLGSYARNYPMILDFTYPISLRDATSEDGYTTDNLEIGSILVCEREILVSWYDHDTNTKGVDIIDYNNRIEEAYFISQLLTVDRERLSTFVDFLIAYARLPDETSVELEYSTDYGVTWVPTSAQEIDEGRQLLISRESVESSTLMVKIIVKSYEDTAPSVESIGIVAY
jgi:hypothetical protein